MDILTFHLVRHWPVILTPERIWYGLDVDFDSTSPHVVQHCQGLAKTLPTQPETSRWYTSPSPRASTLAHALLDASGAEIRPTLEVKAGLVEQKYGEMENLPNELARQKFKAYFDDKWDTPPTGGESLAMLQKRADGEINQIAQNLPYDVDNAVVIGHGGFHKAVYANAKSVRLIDIFGVKSKAIPSLAYMSCLTVQYDRVAGRLLDTVHYREGLPKLAL